MIARAARLSSIAEDFEPFFKRGHKAIAALTMKEILGGRCAASGGDYGPVRTR
jgi:hypothetical protein